LNVEIEEKSFRKFHALDVPAGISREKKVFDNLNEHAVAASRAVQAAERAIPFAAGPRGSVCLSCAET